jgi:hypothetical protein
MNRRRLLIIVVIVVAIVLIAVGVYALIRSRTPASPETAGALPSTGGQTIPEGGFNAENTTTSVAQSSKVAESVLAYAPSADGSVVVVQSDGKILRTTSSATVSLSNTAIADVVNASFSPDGKKALVVFGTPGSLKASVFDTGTLSWQALTGLSDQSSWGPQGYNIVWTSHDGAGRTIVLITAIGTKTATTQTVATLPVTDLAVAWQNAGTLIVYDKPSAYAEGSAWTIDIKTKTVVPLVRETQGLDLAWDAIRNQGIALQGTIASTGGSLSLVNSVGLPSAQFNFLTLPEKCSFAALPIAPATTTAPKAKTTPQTTNYLACGVPVNQNQLSDAHLPDDYFQQALFTTDRLVIVDLDTRGIIFVGTLPTAADATKIQLAGTTAYFINRYDGSLYAVPFNQ